MHKKCIDIESITDVVEECNCSLHRWIMKLLTSPPKKDSTKNILPNMVKKLTAFFHSIILFIYYYQIDAFHKNVLK